MLRTARSSPSGSRHELPAPGRALEVRAPAGRRGRRARRRTTRDRRPRAPTGRSPLRQPPAARPARANRGAASNRCRLRDRLRVFHDSPLWGQRRSKDWASDELLMEQHGRDDPDERHLLGLGDAGVSLALALRDDCLSERRVEDPCFCETTRAKEVAHVLWRSSTDERLDYRCAVRDLSPLMNRRRQKPLRRLAQKSASVAGLAIESGRVPPSRTRPRGGRGTGTGPPRSYP